jgi:hypothetical protein
MGQIATSDARALFTKMLVAVYKERKTPTAFLRSFFRVVENSTKELSIEVQRGTEKIAVDVERGTEGNRNNFSKSTEKIFVPPYYREYFDATELDLYDRLFGSTEIDNGVFNQFMESVADKLRSLQEKIERSYELQCSQVLMTGIVTLNAGVNIDFKRKAGSLVALGGTPWDNDANNPITEMETGANWMRQNGKTEGVIFNVIMGSSALGAFLNNAKVKARADIRNFTLDVVAAPQRNAVGASYHGRVTIGSYMADIWTYPEFYDTAGGVSTPYIDAKKIVMLPQVPNFVLGFAAVPQLIDEKNPTVKKGAYIIGDYKDERNHKHVFDIRSAGVAIPVAVDQIYTKTVLA